MSVEYNSPVSLDIDNLSQVYNIILYLRILSGYHIIIIIIIILYI